VALAAREGRLLDYGCGSGAFAIAAQAQGYDATGIEPFSLLQEREVAPRLIAGTLKDLPPNDEFDIITMWHVLEHLEDPTAMLRQLSQHLSYEGRLVVCVPHIDSWQARLFGGLWFHLDPPRHLHHFSRRSLKLSLAAAGLEDVRWEWWMPEYGMSGWVQSAINSFSPVKNSLYEAVKDRHALDGLPVWKRRSVLAVSILAALPLTVLSIPVEALAARRRRSAVLTVVTRRADADVP
jgi:SAM-dependent methyltransferase